MLEKFSTGLKKIFTFDINYTLILLYFILVFAALYYFELPFILLAFFFVGLVFIPLMYQRKMKEANELKMKLLYAKTKITDRINDFEKILKENEHIENKKAIEEVLKNIKLDHQENQ